MCNSVRLGVLDNEILDTTPQAGKVISGSVFNGACQ